MDPAVAHYLTDFKSRICDIERLMHTTNDSVSLLLNRMKTSEVALSDCKMRISDTGPLVIQLTQLKQKVASLQTAVENTRIELTAELNEKNEKVSRDLNRLVSDSDDRTNAKMGELATNMKNYVNSISVQLTDDLSALRSALHDVAETDVQKLRREVADLVNHVNQLSAMHRQHVNECEQERVARDDVKGAASHQQEALSADTQQLFSIAADERSRIEQVLSSNITKLREEVLSGFKQASTNFSALDETAHNFDAALSEESKKRDSEIARMLNRIEKIERTVDANGIPPLNERCSTAAPNSSAAKEQPLAAAERQALESVVGTQRVLQSENERLREKLQTLTEKVDKLPCDSAGASAASVAALTKSHTALSEELSKLRAQFQAQITALSCSSPGSATTANAPTKVIKEVHRESIVNIEDSLLKMRELEVKLRKYSNELSDQLLKLDDRLVEVEKKSKFLDDLIKSLQTAWHNDQARIEHAAAKLHNGMEVHNNFENQNFTEIFKRCELMEKELVEIKLSLHGAAEPVAAAPKKSPQREHPIKQEGGKGHESRNPSRYRASERAAGY